MPGKNTIPEQIAANKAPYYRALEAADACYENGRKVDVSAMEAMLDGQLAQQLVDVHVVATGGQQQAHAEVSPRGSEERSLWRRAVGTVEKHPVVFGGIFTIIATVIAVIFAG